MSSEGMCYTTLECKECKNKVKRFYAVYDPKYNARVYICEICVNEMDFSEWWSIATHHLNKYTTELICLS